jgi:hypothetical protein
MRRGCLAVGLALMLTLLIACGLVSIAIRRMANPGVEWTTKSTLQVQAPACGTWTEMQGTHASGFATDYKVGLTRVRAGSPDNVWAIGILSGRGHLTLFSSYFQDSPDFIAHWDGKGWSSPDPPRPPGGNSSSDTTYEYKAVEAAGSTGWLAVRVNNFRVQPTSNPDDSPWHNYVHAEIYRWQGRSWVREDLPSSQNAVVYDLLALSESNVWAVGVRGRSQGRIVDEDGEPWAWHWDGATWQSASSGLAQPGGQDGEKLIELGLDHAGRVVAWGQTWDATTSDSLTQYDPPKALTEYEWDGSAWKAKPTYEHPELTRPAAVSVKSLAGSLPEWEAYRDAQKLPDGTIWAVGGYSGLDPAYAQSISEYMPYALAARFTLGRCMR